jgi:hypothetical protein
MRFKYNETKIESSPAGILRDQDNNPEGFRHPGEKYKRKIKY